MSETINPTAHEKPAETEPKKEALYESNENKHEHVAQHEKNSRAGKEVLDKALELAKETELSKTNETVESPAGKRHAAPSKKQREKAFKSSIEDIRHEMSLSEKLTSKLIHSPVVEKTSDFVGSTIARPNAMLSGSITAFVCVTLFYFLAKHYGYQLSGFETIAAFIFGWVLGVVYDYLRLLIGRKD